MLFKRYMENIGKKIKELRQARGISQAALAARVGIIQQSLHAIEAGKVRKPRYIVEIARALGVDPETFEEKGASPTPIGDNYLHGPDKLPLYGRKVLGVGALMVDFSERVGLIERPHLLSNVDGAFAVSCPDSSMEPRFTVGDYIYIHPNRPAADGDYVFIHFKNKEAIIRQLQIAGNREITVANFVMNAEKTGYTIKSDQIDLNNVDKIYLIVGSLKP